MASVSDIGPATRSRAAPSSSTGSCSKAGISAASSTSDKVLKVLEDTQVRKTVFEIADKDMSVESRIKCAVDDALTGDNVRLEISAAMADALTKATVVDALLDAPKEHEGYKQHLSACMSPVAEHIAAEYAASV